MLALDQKLFHWLNNLAGQHLHPQLYATDVAQYGILLFAFLIACLALFRSAHPAQTRRLILLAFTAALVALLVSSVLGPLVGRDRPFEVDRRHMYLLISGPSDSSFPSDHAIAAAAMVGVLWSIPRWWLRFGALFFAAAIAVSRVIVGVHWPSDVIVSSFLGFFIGWGTVWLSQPLQPALDRLLKKFDRIGLPLSITL